MTGVDRIAAERRRQQEAEGFTPDRDDEYTHGELIAAAVAYACAGSPEVVADFWPWAEEWWKPSPDPFRNLERAGALIAAELDRRERALGLGTPAAWECVDGVQCNDAGCAEGCKRERARLVQSAWCLRCGGSGEVTRASFPARFSPCGTCGGTGIVKIPNPKSPKQDADGRPVAATPIPARQVSVW